MKIRVQKLDRHRNWSSWRARFVVCVQPTGEEAWDCRIVRGQARADRELEDAGLNDFRDRSELFQQAQAAVRAWGVADGFAQYNSLGGVERYEGDPRRAP